MWKISVILLAFLLTVINGLYLRKNTYEEDDKRSFFPGVDCTTNSDCQALGIFDTCLITASTGRGNCVVQDAPSTKKRFLSQSKCVHDSECFRFGFQVTCVRGICMHTPPVPVFPDSDETEK
ncbi:Hypothetical predicted protein [Paramuricea clavata]|uniref:Uncharacterized protein n=1 Tax=Paramuricea clavata TaxID=317549 RepID=A0A7D9ERY4_PARCT|nr:Hypothetical predicted protein [Paramuricea clavata]